MDFVDGKRILEYTEECSKTQASKMIINVLKQCQALDKIGIDKEEMHHPRKHIIVTASGAVMIDFERAHFNRTPKNVTHLCSF